MINCSNPKLQELLLLYVEGELSLPEAGQVAEHVRICKACEQEVKAIEESLRLVLPPCPSPDMMASYLEQKLSVEAAGKIENHLKKCASCKEAANAFREIETAGPEKAVEKIPSWFDSALKQTFPKKNFLDYISSFFLFRRPSLALAVHAAMGMLLLFWGTFYSKSMTTTISAPPLSAVRTQKAKPPAFQTPAERQVARLEKETVNKVNNVRRDIAKKPKTEKSVVTAAKRPVKAKQVKKEQEKRFSRVALQPMREAPAQPAPAPSAKVSPLQHEQELANSERAEGGGKQQEISPPPPPVLALRRSAELDKTAKEESKPAGAPSQPQASSQSKAAASKPAEQESGYIAGAKDDAKLKEANSPAPPLQEERQVVEKKTETYNYMESKEEVNKKQQEAPKQKTPKPAVKIARHPVKVKQVKKPFPIVRPHAQAPAPKPAVTPAHPQRKISYYSGIPREEARHQEIVTKESYVGYYLMFGSVLFWALAGVAAYRLWIVRK